MNNKNIYVIGRAKGSYRTHNLIKYLLDKDFNVYYNSIHLNSFSNSTGIKFFFRKFIRFFDEFIKRLVIIYNILLSDIVIVPAMCNEFKFELNLASIFRKKIIVDFYISIYDTEIFDYKNFKPDSKKAKYFYNIDFSLLKKADFIFFLNQTEATYYLSLFKINYDTSKHIILPLCIEDKPFCKLNYFNSKNKLFNICWWGNYLPLHGLENILESMFYLKKNKDLKFKFYIFGNNDAKKISKYNKLIERLNLKDEVIIKSGFTFKNGKLSEFLIENCDLVLGNFGNSLKSKNVITNKLLDGVAMQSPVLSRESKAPKSYFSENEIFYSSINPKEISKKILEISKLSKKEIDIRVSRSFRVFDKNFSVKSFYMKLDEFFIKFINVN